MTGRNVHTVPKDDGKGNKWAVELENADRVSKLFPTKAEAQAYGRERAISEKSEHVIHKKDGTIGDKDSYGNDNSPPKG